MQINEFIAWNMKRKSKENYGNTIIVYSVFSKIPLHENDNPYIHAYALIDIQISPYDKQSHYFNIIPQTPVTHIIIQPLFQYYSTNTLYLYRN